MQAQTMETGSKPNPVHTTGLCLLSLDGGGIRGLSTLYVLDSIMKALNHKRDEAGHPPVKPCEVFDLIGGTDTGGLIAIMLGRLKMDAETCISAYVELIATVFKEKNIIPPISNTGKIKPRFDLNKLQDAIMDIAARHGASGTEPFNNGQENGSKVFVCATAKETAGITRLRSYNNLPGQLDISATICEAALATSAATGLFDPVPIGARRFVDGALGANNPVEEVESEAARIWLPESRGHLQDLVKCFISIGTGNPGIASVRDDNIGFFRETLVKITTETEKTERKFIERWGEQFDEKCYFRFNVDQGLQDVGLDEDEKRGQIEAATDEYIAHQNQMFKVRDCVQNLQRKQYPTGVRFYKLVHEYKEDYLFTGKFLQNKDAADYQTESRLVYYSSNERHEDSSDSSGDTEYGEEQWRNVCRSRIRHDECLNCGRTSHYEDSCYVPCGRCSMENHTQGECRNYVECYKCGGRNHMARNC